ncbi:MAG: MinD/ParA family protein [Eubacterium sp.]|nr:MinD/ParA family protein [Eubacterium sp.]
MDQAEQLRNIIKKRDSKTDHERVAKVITVTSGKGGVGKTSLSVNLAIQLGRLGKRVVVFDADFGLANIEIMLGIRPKYNLADLMYRGKSIEDIITYGPENIGFISGGSGINELANLTRDQVFSMIHRLEELDRIADVIIVDTGAGISDTVLEFVAASEEVLLVATPEPTSITDAYALLKTLNKKASYRPEKTVVKMVANQVRGEREAAELFEKLGVVVGKFLDVEVDFLGSVPYNKNMQRAVMRQAPVSISDPESDSARAVKNIAGCLEDVMTEKTEKGGIVKLFSSVIRMRFMK